MSEWKPIVHDLKCWPVHLTRVIKGTKPFEIRVNDRDYKQGDFLMLREWLPGQGRYGFDYALVKVLSMLDDPDFCKEDRVTMGILLLDSGRMSPPLPQPPKENE